MLPRVCDCDKLLKTVRGLLLAVLIPGDRVHRDLKTLIDLQGVDNSVAVLTSRIESAPLEMQALKSQLQEFHRILDERKTSLAANQKHRRELDAEVQEIRSKITKHKDQLYQVKTNDQYRAMQKEVTAEEGNLRRAEDRILEEMVEAEQIEKHIREAEERLKGEKERIAAEIQNLESLKQRDEVEQASLLDQRRTLAGALSDEVLAHYERLRRGRNGVALAEVRDGLCNGCHVRLRPQAYNEIRTGDAFLTCEACARILYYDPEAATAAAPGGTSQSTAQG